MYKQQLGVHYWDNLCDAPVPFAFIFCSSLPIEERNSSVVLSVLLAQLCAQNSDLLAAVASRMSASKHSLATIEELSMVFETDVPKFSSQYYLIINDLDRIHGFREVLQAIMSGKSQYKILLLQRSIKTSVSHPVLEITPEIVDQDIRKVLSSQIVDLKKRREPEVGSFNAHSKTSELKHGEKSHTA